MGGEYKKRDKNEDLDKNYPSEKSEGSAYFPGKPDSGPWWKASSEKDYAFKNSGFDAKKILNENWKAQRFDSYDFKKVKGIPVQMGDFKTETAGTVMVGYDNNSSSSDIGFTVVPKSMESQMGAEGRDKDDPNTYFGANFDGKEKVFKAGEISFSYSKKHGKRFEKIGKDNQGTTEKDEENLLYDCEKEKDILKGLERQELIHPKEKSSISSKKYKIEKIKDEKEKKNEDFLKEMKEFIEKMEDGKIKVLTESDEVARRKKRILELSGKVVLIENLRNDLEKVIGKEAAQEAVADLFAKARIKGFSMGEFIKMIEKIKNKFYVK